ncbi:MAG TPA: hypothetical protein VF290_05790 [Pyrinomonadaceae bacterium]
MDQPKLIVRLVALVAVTFSLIVVVKQDDQVGLGMAQSMPVFQPQAPDIVARNEPGSPLVISAERQLPKTEQAPEIVFNVTNVTNKTIIAFAIRVEEAAGQRTPTSKILLQSLELSATDLPPNRSQSIADTYENVSSEQHRITLSVDYVEFSDGKKWGVDSLKSSEKVAGSRAGLKVLMTRLAETIGSTNANELANVLESMGNIEPPPQHSEEWNYGFQWATRSVVNRLKRANQTGGLSQVNTEMSRFAKRRAGGK